MLRKFSKGINKSKKDPLKKAKLSKGTIIYACLFALIFDEFLPLYSSGV
jgi:predicted ATPase